MSRHTIVEHRDQLETAILLAMNARDKGLDQHRIRTADRRLQTAKRSGGGRQPRLRSALQSLDMGAFCSKEPALPASMFTFDAISDDRLFAASLAHIVVDPAKAIGKRLEIAIPCEDGRLKWTLLRPRAKPPKGLIAATNRRVSWYELHYRVLEEGQPEFYVKRAFPLTEDLLVPSVKAVGWPFDPRQAEQDRQENEASLAVALSVFEDAVRGGAYLATVEEQTRLTFPIGQESYLSFLRMRDGYRNTPTGRRNPILHWVAEHFRTSGRTPVKAHLRGAEEFVVGPMKLTIEPTPGYAPFMADEAAP